MKTFSEFNNDKPCVQKHPDYYSSKDTDSNNVNDLSLFEQWNGGPE